MKDSVNNPIWGGRFSDNLDKLMVDINASIDFDRRLFRHDIRGSIAHCQMLVDSGIISPQDGVAICDGLEVISREIAEGKFQFSRELEDIHMNIETRLTELIGEPAQRLHTARSRNDQVATDLRLYIRDGIDKTIEQLRDLQLVLIAKADSYHDTIMPGFTHLQTAQPVIFGHHLLAFVEMLERDKGRFLDARKRLNQCPLGAAALAGTSFPIDRFQTSAKLGFSAPMANSLDSVSARDFVLEVLAVAAILATHLSRFAEELVLWSSQPFSLIKLSDRFTTGSSIMPQKRNPDAAELVRGKVGRIVGALNCLFMVIKALPLTYSKDMQEDKEPIFDTLDTIELILTVFIAMIDDLTANEPAMTKLADCAYSTATDLADWLVREHKIPFRQAHHITGRVVAYGEEHGLRLAEIPVSALQLIDDRLDESFYQVVAISASVNSRTSYGGTAPVRVKEQIAVWRERLTLTD